MVLNLLMNRQEFSYLIKKSEESLIEKHMDRVQELKNCTSAKTILMIMIVLYHSMIVFGGRWGPYSHIADAPIIGYIAKWLNSFHIYAFTLISGYIFYYIKYEKGGYQKYLPFLGNKARRLLVPYVFITVVWAAPIYYLYLPDADIVSMFVLGTSPSQLWFLLMLFWVFAIFWLISDFTDRHPIWGGLIVCVLYCIGMFAPSLYCLNRGLQYILFFYCGFIIRKCDLVDCILYKIPSFVYIVIDVLLFAVVCAIGDGEGILIKLLLLAFNTVLHMLGAVGAFVLLQRFVNRFLQDNKVLQFFSRHSMVIYLVHQQLIYFSIGWFRGIVPPVILVLINFIFSFVVSTVFSVLMSKTKITRFLVGNK